MRLIGSKIFIRITEENRESIYTKKITRDDGTVVNLWKTIPVKDDLDERHNSLNVQTAIVEEVGDGVDWIKKGDTALINYEVCNDKTKFIKKDGKDDIYFLEVNTTYHTEDQIEYRNRKPGSYRDQIVHLKNDYNEMSSLLGVLRGNELIANDPYVFFATESNKISMVSEAGILYTETQKFYQREVIAISKESTERFGVKKGDIVLLDDFDCFTVKLEGEHTVDAVNDVDILCKVEFTKEAVKNWKGFKK